MEERKRLFREHLLTFVPLAEHLQQILSDREDHRAPRDRFEFELEDHLNFAGSLPSWKDYLTRYGYYEFRRCCRRDIVDLNHGLAEKAS